MMGWQTGDQRQLFYLFNLERRIPASHLLRRINPIVMQVLADLREKLAPFYSDIGRPSIDSARKRPPKGRIVMIICFASRDSGRRDHSRFSCGVGDTATDRILFVKLGTNI